MKKSELKEVIQNIVAKKLAEARGDAPKYGYIISGEGTDDPTLQLIGYGNMPKSAWKKKIEEYTEELLKRVKAGDWNNAAYLMELNGILNKSINMMKELDESYLKEIETSTDTADSTKSYQDEKAQKELDAAKKKEQAALEAKRKIDKQRADFDKRNYPILNKNQRAATDANIKVGKASEKVADLEADIAKKQARQ